MRVCQNCASIRNDGSFYSDDLHPADVCKPCIHRPRRASVVSSVKDRQKRNRTAILHVVRQFQSQKEPFIYLVQAHRDLKIGFSQDILKRLQTLETGARCPVNLLAIVSGGRSLEKELHQRFEHLRTHREWFRDKDQQIFNWFSKMPGAMVFLEGFAKQDAPLVAHSSS